MSFASGLKTIVVATDLNGQSEAALEYARKLATNYGARIVLAHGLDPMEYADVEAVPGRVRKGLTEGARAVLDNWDAELPNFVKIVPRDYRRALLDLRAEQIAAKTAAE